MADIVQKRNVWPELSGLLRGFSQKLSQADHQMIQTWINGRMNDLDDISMRHPSKSSEFVCVSTAKARNILAAYGGKIREDGHRTAARALELLDEYLEAAVVVEDERVVARMRFVFETLHDMTTRVPSAE